MAASGNLFGKRISRFIKVCIAILMVFASDANADDGQFAIGDFSEDAKLIVTGMPVVAAINCGNETSNGDVTVSGLLHKASNSGIVQVQFSGPYADTEFGSLSENAKKLCREIAGVSSPLRLTIPGLKVGNRYLLQVYYTTQNPQREIRAVAEGQSSGVLLVTKARNLPQIISYRWTASDDCLNFELASSGFDENAFISGYSVQQLASAGAPAPPVIPSPPVATAVNARSELPRLVYDSDRDVYYAFHEGRYSRFKHGQLPDQEMLSISAWPELAGGWQDFQSIVHDSKRKVYYAFKDGQYVKFQIGQKARMQPPAAIAGPWPGLANGWDRFDHILYNADLDAYYAFKGRQYISFEWSKAVTDKFYPANTAANWPGLANGFENPDQIIYNSDKKLYYAFKGNQYVAFKHGKAAEQGYPLHIANWPGFYNLDWSGATVYGFEQGMKSALASATDAKLSQIDGPVSYAQISVGNHVNGMAVVNTGSEEWIVVNYPNYDGKKGRLLFWSLETGEFADYHEFSMDSRSSSTKTGFPAAMDADGRFVAVTTGNSGYVKLFDFSNPKVGVKELENLELKIADGMVENVGLAYFPQENKYLLTALKGESRFWLSQNNNLRDLSQANGWVEIENPNKSVSIPYGEAGSPLLFLKGSEFAAISLGGHDTNRYGYQVTYFQVSKNSAGKWEVSNHTSNSVDFVEMKNVPYNTTGSYASWRWGGTATTIRNEGGIVANLYAAPKRLDDAYADYYTWSGLVRSGYDSSKPRASISLNSNIWLQNSDGKYLGPTQYYDEDYERVTMSTYPAAYSLSSGQNGSLKHGSTVQMKRNERWVYETNTGNVFGYRYDPADKTEDWIFEKVQDQFSSPGSEIRSGDTVKIHNGYWTDHYICDYLSGYAASGGYDRPNTWIIQLSASANQ
jgi:hypothetical protein